MSLNELKKLLPPPDEPVDVPTTAEWDVVAEELGAPLPADYREFVEAYGSGSFDDWWWFGNPLRARPKVYEEEGSTLAWDTWCLRRYVETFDDFHDGEFDYVIHPNAEGLIALAAGERDYLTWNTKGQPEEWPIVVVRRGRYRDLIWSAFDGTFTEFLVAVLRREFRCSFWDDDFPSEVVSYATRSSEDR